jgi:hypothetical protein
MWFVNLSYNDIIIKTISYLQAISGEVRLNLNVSDILIQLMSVLECWTCYTNAYEIENYTLLGIMQQVVVISYWHLGTTYGSHL